MKIEGVIFDLDGTLVNSLADLADAFPGNDIFIITSEQAAESSGAWKYKGGELTAFAVKFRINGTSETAAGTDINYFFLL